MVLTNDNRSEIYNELINHMKKYGKNNSQSKSSTSREAELRKMYDDGIITKEELVDLLGK